MLLDLLTEVPFEERNIPSRTTLLKEGSIADSVFYIQDGILRESHNHDGKDITVQFFFEGHAVASIESFTRGTPSLFSIESVTAAVVRVYKKKDIMAYLERHGELQKELAEFALSRMIDYSHLFLSRIRDTPQERYENLVAEHPEIISRIPQHFIASYLGITPVSLSRIRSRR